MTYRSRSLGAPREEVEFVEDPLIDTLGVVAEAQVGHAKKPKLFDEALEVVQAEDPEMREIIRVDIDSLPGPLVLQEPTDEYQTPAVEEHTPTPVEMQYFNFKPYFELYSAVRAKDDVLTGAIEELVSQIQPSGFYVAAPKAFMDGLGIRLKDALRFQAATRWNRAYNDPESFTPAQLGEVLLELVRLCDGNMELVGELMHRGY